MGNVLSAIFASTLVMVAADTARSATVWDCYVYASDPGSASVQAMTRLIGDVKQQTHGELQIDLHLGGSLPIKVNGITDAVGGDRVQLGDDAFSAVPLTAIPRLPMLLQSDRDLTKALNILRPHLDDAFRERGVVVLGQYAHPFQVIWGKSKITSLADIKGLKLRVVSSEHAEFVRRFGGIPLPLGFPDVSGALERDVVQGVLGDSAGGGLTWRTWLKYRYGLPVSYLNSTIIVNRRALESLTPETQQILRDAAVKIVSRVIPYAQRLDDEVTARLGNEGTVLTAASSDDIHEATERLRPYWDEWAHEHGPEAVSIVNEIRAAVGR